jgi:hypothetical protein
MLYVYDPKALYYILVRVYVYLFTIGSMLITYVLHHAARIPTLTKKPPNSGSEDFSYFSLASLA